MIKYFSALLLILFASSCDLFTDNFPNGALQQTYVPVYYKPELIEVTKFSPARAIKTAGKQFVIGNLLLQNDVNEGIHLIDVSTPASPKKLGFLEIPLCTEIAVKQGYLYTNNYSDLLVFDIRGPGEPKLLKRIKKAFPPVNQEYPPFFNVAFECPDASKGVVVDWVLSSNTQTRCRR